MVEISPMTAGQAVGLLAELAVGLADAPSLDELLVRALQLATDIVPGCDQAGVSLLRSGRLETPASCGDLAMQCDKLQERLGEGPCISALLDADVYRVDDIDVESRWPSFARGARELGLGSMLGVRLPTPRDRMAALNLYSSRADAFTPDAEALATAYATHVGLALSALDKENNLRRALDTRELIGQAMGILMERHRVTATQAFDLMVHVSQRGNVKLREIAEELVRTGQLPER